jgi:hypothetical protein
MRLNKWLKHHSPIAAIMLTIMFIQQTSISVSTSLKLVQVQVMFLIPSRVFLFAQTFALQACPG